MNGEAGFNQVIIDKSALIHNLKTMEAKSPLGSKLMAVVKGDAYGHGLVEAAKVFLKAGALGLGVLDVHEGLILRKNSIGSPIFVLAGAEGPQLNLAVKNGLTVFVYRLEQAEALANAAREESRPAKVMLKFDTGMGRLGFLPADFQKVLTALMPLNLCVIGLATHLATAGDKEALAQLEIFKRLTKEAAKWPEVGREHSVLASSGLLAHSEVNYSWVRPGICLYGYEPGGQARMGLQPAMKVTSRLIQVRPLKKGETVSYSHTFKAPRDMILGTAPIGYIHGLGRIRSNKGWALIGGRKAPQLGNVCMNLSMYDLTDIPGAQAGDEVVVLGRQGEEVITADQVAAWEETISYEILGHLGRLNPRIYS